MESITIIGNVGQPAVIQIANGKEFISFSVAVNKYRKVWEKDENNKGHEVKKQSTNWYSVSLPIGMKNLVPFLVKGTKVYVQGSFSAKMYNSKQGWEISLNIYGDKVELLSSVKSENEEVPAGVDPETGEILDGQN